MTSLSNAIYKTVFSFLIFGVASSSYALSPRTCNPKVPKTVKYRPVDTLNCGGKAAIYLSGNYFNSFSVVFKKVDHGDRLANDCPRADCSPFKAQKIIRKNGQKIACFGAAGNSPVFKGYDPDFGYKAEYVVKWISIKRANSGQIKDVDIYCLPKPYPQTPLN
jgi:hypothetical protein